MPKSCEFTNLTISTINLLLWVLGESICRTLHLQGFNQKLCPFLSKGLTPH